MGNLSNNNIDIQKLKKLFIGRVIMKEVGCWDFKGSRSDGYCNIKCNNKTYKAHRVSWMIHVGPIPKGMLVCHKCDLRHCCRPDHLFLGTNADNAKDRDRKGNFVVLRGEKNGMSVLTLDQVKEIKYLIGKGIPASKICKYLKIDNYNAVFDIKRGKTWKHVK